LPPRKKGDEIVFKFKKDEDEEIFFYGKI